MDFIKNIKKIILDIIDFPKSLYINYKCLPMCQAKKMPIKAKWNIKIGKIERNSIEIKSKKVVRGMIKLGYNGAKFVSKDNMYFTIKNGGKILFDGETTIAEGLNIIVDAGIVEFGKNFYANRNLQIQCEKSIRFLDNNLFGWNVKVRDTDGHAIVYNNQKNDYRQEIIIDEHVWVASDVTILKGTYIPSNSVVACNSLVCGLKQQEKGCIIGGIPAKKIRENINWIE